VSQASANAGCVSPLLSQLDDLKNKIKYRTSEPYELARKLTIIKRRNELRFIRIGFFSQQKEATKPDHQIKSPDK
jgi:hypothetical protein